MKKILFLLFGVIFAIAGCADESSNNPSCPISSADFKFDVTYNNGDMEVVTVLMSDDKKQYINDVKWYVDGILVEGYAPHFYLTTEEQKRPFIAQLYYQKPSNKCGDDLDVNDIKNHYPKNY